MLVIFICLRTIQGDQAAVKNGNSPNCNSSATVRKVLLNRFEQSVKPFLNCVFVETHGIAQARVCVSAHVPQSGTFFSPSLSFDFRFGATVPQEFIRTRAHLACAPSL
jgi:hypothetical protein